MGASSSWQVLPRPRVAGTADGRRRLVVAALWSLAVLVSALQIYLRELHRGVPAPWADVLLANLLAWLPWLAAVGPAMRLERRFPLAGAAWRRHGALHLALAAGFAAGFLLYLSVFHLLHLDGRALTAAALRGEWAEQMGRFFMTAAALYCGIVVTGVAERSWREQRRQRRPATVASGPLAEEDGLVVRSAGRLERLDPAEIRWIGAEGNYARLRLADRSILHRCRLGSLADQLAGRRFVRIHRSIVVNLRHVRALESRSHGDAVLVLEDGSRLKVSRTYRKGLKRLGF